ncbi:MAG: FecR domain-containing protein [Deltaproteobacteria bacterium]|nr:FecR domain-containing protein [Deltaproteobacteria bacterium]MBT4639310.1 FecR domain-containing protein [Deltaproteobacteria bacterium]
MSKYYSENYPKSKKSIKNELISQTTRADSDVLDDLSLSSAEGIGRISAIHQMVLIRRKGETLDVKKPYTILKREDTVLTNEKGKARIELTRGAEIFVTPSSNIYVTRHFIDRYNHNYLLSLEGKIRTRTKRSERGRLQIKTSTATVIVKGTDFVVDTKSGVTKVATIEGVVTLTSQKTKKSVEVTMNQMVSVSAEGQISKPEKIPVSIIKDLSHSGETGIKELDREIKKEKVSQQTSSGLSKPGKRRKPQKMELGMVLGLELGNNSDSFIFKELDREIKKENASQQTGFGLSKPGKRQKPQKKGLGMVLGLELGNNSGRFIFIDFKLSPQSQIHYQNVVSTFKRSGDTENTALGDLQRTTTASTFRYFIQESGKYCGLGVGISQSTQSFRNDSSITRLRSNGLFALAEFGAQYYLGKKPGTSLFMNVSMQYISYLDYNDNYSTGKISTSEYDVFTKQAKTNLLALLVGVGWFF